MAADREGGPMAKSIDPGSLLRRYQAGEHEAVWADMMALGTEVRKSPYAEDAWAVARETMRRARHNVELIIRRLDQLGYQFWNGERGTLGPKTFSMSIGGKIVTYPSAAAAIKEGLNRDPSRIPSPGMRKHVEDMQRRVAGLLGPFMEMQAKAAAQQGERIKKQAAITDHLTDPNVFSPPSKDETTRLRDLERKGMFLPLSLRAWFEEVGDVNLAGAHPSLCFWEDEDFPGIYADPLMVSLDHFMFEIEGWLEERDAGEDPEPITPVIGVDAQLKARLAVADDQLDDGYTIELPDTTADAPLAGEPHRTSFVNYLRIAFRWGGFPGWERQAKRPEKELKFLSDGLLPI
jgi:hypothetical protein